MKYSIDLDVASPKEWIDAVLADFNSFLQDHADCERKASAMAMSFVAKCPDRTDIIPELIETAVEELEHFQQVYKLMQERGVSLKAEMPQDNYIHALIKLCRSGREERLIDRFLVASIVECRGAERFKLIADNVEDKKLKKFYKELWTSEAKHGNIFVKMMLNYFDEDKVYPRLKELSIEEGKIIRQLEIRAALH